MAFAPPPRRPRSIFFCVCSLTPRDASLQIKQVSLMVSADGTNYSSSGTGVALAVKVRIAAKQRAVCRRCHLGSRPWVLAGAAGHAAAGDPPPPC